MGRMRTLGGLINKQLERGVVACGRPLLGKNGER